MAKPRALRVVSRTLHGAYCATKFYAISTLLIACHVPYPLSVCGAARRFVVLALCGVGVVWCYACVCLLCVITCLNVFAYIYGCMSQARSQRHFGRGVQEGHDSRMLSGWA